MLFVHVGCLLLLLPAPNQTQPIPVRAPQSPAPNRHHCRCGQHQGRCCTPLQIVTLLEDTVSGVVAIISAAHRLVARQTHCCHAPAHSTGSLGHPPW